MTLINSAQLIRLDATALQSLLTQGVLTSVQLILSVLAQIEKEDQQGLCLHAMLDVAPKTLLIERASQLDQERLAGKLRGPLHGIPITLKDCIGTHSQLGLRTSVGSTVLLESIVANNASVVDRVLEAGLIIIGKTNLTEYCFMKDDSNLSGWSAVGGKTRSAYTPSGPENQSHRGHPYSPGGSSTGSAVSVSAGYAPLSIAEETVGSIIHPGSRAALYGLKPTIGKMPGDGLWTISTTCDALGPMAKSSKDLLALYNIMLANKSDRLTHVDKDFSKLRIGFLDPNLWTYSTNYFPPISGVYEQTKAAFLGAVKTIQQHAKHIVFPVTLPSLGELVIDGKYALDTILYYEYAENINQYLKKLTVSPVRTLEELIEWNNQSRDLKDKPQNKLVKACNERPSKACYDRAKQHMQALYRDNGIDRALRENAIDLIVAPSLSQIAEVAAASGYPIATVPLGALRYNQMPFGLAVLTTAHREDVLFSFMQAFEQRFPKRSVPRFLDSAS